MLKLNMLKNVLTKIKPLQARLANHELYSSLNNEVSIISFMELHVYSVWDFMNLLKYLQHELTCTSYPWIPKAVPKLSRLINEIVLEEESDIINGSVTSHYYYYFKTLKYLKSDIDHLIKFNNDLNTLMSYEKLISQNYIPNPAKAFMTNTYSFIEEGLLSVASAFAFGRESLVPSLFDPIKDQLKQSQNIKYNDFISYLERHIELDGELHSKLAFEMVEILATSPKDWEIIENVAVKALEARIRFWNEINGYISNKI